MSSKKRASELIRESYMRNVIVHADYSPNLGAELERRAHDSVVNGDVIEYWGGTAAKAWRVHLDK